MINITEMDNGKYKLEAELTEEELREMRNSIGRGVPASNELHDELNFAMEIVHLEY